MANSPRPIFSAPFPCFLKLTIRTARRAFRSISQCKVFYNLTLLGRNNHMCMTVRNVLPRMKRLKKSKQSYISRAYKFEMKRTRSSKCIQQINRLLSLNLAWNCRDKVLDLQDNVKDLQICASGDFTVSDEVEESPRKTYRILRVVSRSCFPCSVIATSFCI